MHFKPATFTLWCIGYNKSRLVYYCPIKRARTSFGPRGPQPQELVPLPFHTHNLNHVSAFFYPCLSCLGLACLTLVSPLLHTGCWLINYQHTWFCLFSFYFFCSLHQSFSVFLTKILFMFIFLPPPGFCHPLFTFVFLWLPFHLPDLLQPACFSACLCLFSLWPLLPLCGSGWVGLTVVWT
jgi:hypothetical protein